MKKIIIPLTVAVIFFSGCRTEEQAGPANEHTFIRYFGSESNTRAVLAIQAGDGYTLLSATERSLGAGQVSYKARVTRTDIFGNLVWERNYPEEFEDTPGGISPASFIQLANSGYLIVGDSINIDGKSKIQLLFIDADGTLQPGTTISGEANTSLHGHAVYEDGNGDLAVLGSISGDPLRDMYIAKLDGETFQINWQRKHGDGAGNNTLVNRLFGNSAPSADTSSNFYWGSSWLNPSSNNYKPRLISAGANAEGANLGHGIGDPQVNERANDFCNTTGGWAITGSVVNSSGNEDIYVLRVSNTSDIFFKTVIDDFPNEVDKAQSICLALDGGYVVLGTVTTANRGEDLYLTRLDLSGNQVWSGSGYRIYGNSDRQVAASVRPTSDGYLVFGTTYFDDAEKLILLKVNRNGEL